jgi:hypothetical protein
VQPDRVVRQQIENLKLSHPEILEDEEAWLATLESETDFEQLLTTIVRRIEDTKILAIGTKDRFEELKARKERFEHRIETLRDLAFRIMQSAEIAKLEMPEATLSLRAGQQQLVGDADPASLPDEFCKISRDLNRTAIKEALKAGMMVPGFTLSNSQPNLTIRIK